MSKITLILPDDWHLHLRDGAALATTVPYATRGFGRGIVMPNLNPPVTTVARAKPIAIVLLQTVLKGLIGSP